MADLDLDAISASALVAGDGVVVRRGAPGVRTLEIVPANAIDPWAYVKLTAAVVNSATTPVDTGLTIGSLAANTHYIFEGMLFLQSSATTTGARPGLTWPGGTLQESAWVISPNSATAFASRFWGAPSAANAAATGVATVDEGIHARLEGQFVTGASPTGALTVTLQSEISGSEVRMMANSWIRYRTIP